MPPRNAKYLAEALGTFCLVFLGTAAAVVDARGGALGPVGVGLVFGLAVLAMVYSFGHVSGAHLNPAATLGFWAAGRLEAREVPRYALAQFCGALAASGAVRAVFGPGSLGATVPAGTAAQSLALEFLLSFILVLVILSVATDHRAQGAMAGVAIGATVCLEAILGGPVSGASMNPARSLAPALVGGRLEHQWIYCLGPLAGAWLAARAQARVRCDSPGASGPAGCC